MKSQAFWLFSFCMCASTYLTCSIWGTDRWSFDQCSSNVCLWAYRAARADKMQLTTDTSTAGRCSQCRHWQALKLLPGCYCFSVDKEWASVMLSCPSIHQNVCSEPATPRMSDAWVITWNPCDIPEQHKLWYSSSRRHLHAFYLGVLPNQDMTEDVQVSDKEMESFKKYSENISLRQVCAMRILVSRMQVH